MPQIPDSDKTLDVVSFLDDSSSAVSTRALYWADETLEVLWEASVSGLAPCLPPPLSPAIAILHDRMCLDKAPDWPAAGAHIETGARLQAEGNWHGALFEFGAAYACTAPGTACLLQIAAVYLAAGDYELAERWLRRKSGEAGGGSDPDTLLHLAHSLWGGGKINEALQVCDRLIERHPHHPAGIDTAALMHTQQGDPRKALEACTRLLTAISDADSAILTSIARRTVLSAVKLGEALPKTIFDRISALAEASDDEELVALLQRAEIHTAAKDRWLKLFGADREPAFGKALSQAELTILKELLDIERSAPVVGMEAVTSSPQAEHPVSLDGRFERAFNASDLSREGILATQLSIIDEGEVTLLSPHGDVVSSSTSIVLNYHPENREYGSVIAYYFDGARPLFIFFATENSWPIAWYDPIAHMLICYDSVIGEFTAYLQDRVRELKLCCLADPESAHRYLCADASRKAKPPTLLVGTLDYLSTHLFADLQGLTCLVDRLPRSAIGAVIVGAPEPFGSIESIVPELGDATIIRDLPVDAVALNQELWRENRMIARVTGCVVEQPLADTLMTRADGLAEPAWRRAVDDLRDASGPLLFIALRAHNRRWLADGAAIAGVLNKLHVQHPDLGVIFDGHCLGGTPPSQGLIDRENDMIADIVEHLDTGIGRLISAGKTIQDSIYAASASTVHLSAQGTSATKSVLIAGLPGVVISSTQFGWNAVAFRSPSPTTITLSELSVDAELNNIQCDFSLAPDAVLNALLDVIQATTCSPPT